MFMLSFRKLSTVCYPWETPNPFNYNQEIKSTYRELLERISPEEDNYNEWYRLLFVRNIGCVLHCGFQHYPTYPTKQSNQVLSATKLGSPHVLAHGRAVISILEEIQFSPRRIAFRMPLRPAVPSSNGRVIRVSQPMRW